MNVVVRCETGKGRTRAHIITLAVIMEKENLCAVLQSTGNLVMVREVEGGKGAE